MKIKINKKSSFIILALISILIILSFTTISIIKKSNQNHIYYTISKEVVENVIEISGTVEAAQEQVLQALSDGTVMNVFVKEGDHVKKGDVIIQLDDTTQQYNLAKQDYSIATATITGSMRELKLLRTERIALEQKVRDRKVSATFDGLIAALDVAQGDSLEAKDPVGTLVNVDYLIAEVEIAETDVGKLKIGQKVEFTFSAYKDKKVLGKLIGWPAIGEITSRGATVVKAKIKIEDYPKEILPNYSFTGKIQISEPEDILLVDRLAIGFENKKTYVIDKNTKEKKFVKVQPYARSTFKIIEGNLKEGDQLLQVSKPKLSGTEKNKNPSSIMPGTNMRPPRM